MQPDFGGVTAVNVVGARETVGGPVVQQSGIQCFNCKEFGHYAKECRKPKRVKDSTYHKEKMLLCKQAEKGFNFKHSNLMALATGWKRSMNKSWKHINITWQRLQEVPNATQHKTRPLRTVEKGDNLKYVEYLEDELDELESDKGGKAEFPHIVQLIIFIVNSGCTKHMTGNIYLLCNFIEKYLGTVRFGNDQFASILGYGDLVQGNITIKRVYYVEGLNHNLFSVGQFCDADLEAAFRKSTCFVRDLQGNDLLTGNRGTDLYIISLQETTSSIPIWLMAKASPTQAWLWHRRLSHLNFDYINLLSKKDVVIGLPKLNSKGRLNLLHMDLCGPMRVASINGKKYILVIVDDYSRYTWTLFLRSKDETPEVLKDFLTMIQRNLQAPVISVRTDRGTEFLNKTLHAFFKEEGIEHQTSTPRTPEQNGVVERRNRTLVEAARTIDGENLDKMKEKGDPCILVGYSTQSKGYRVYNKRTRPRDTTVPSQQELDLLFGPLYDEFFNAGTSRVIKSSSPTDNSVKRDTIPSMNIQPPSEPSIPTNVHAEGNNDNQAEFTNPFCTPVQEIAESSSRNIGNSNVHTFNQPQDSEYRWTKDHPLTQVRGNPSKPVQTRRQLTTDP
ncbi:retrovirus-related pol polyprotein from transposon TNT 1-94 [Tanacetum coccineum]